MLTRTVNRVGIRLESWIRPNPLTNVYGMSRSIMAAALALTLLSTPAAVLFPGKSTVDIATTPNPLASISFYAIVHLPITYSVLFSVIALVLIAIGWRPRWTGILHWWITYSFHLSSSTQDGGDKIASIITLLMIPMTLADSRHFHWSPPVAGDLSLGGDLTRLCSWMAALMIRLQIAGIYFHSAIAKLGIPEWRDGTALYYYFTLPTFGAPPPLLRVLMPILRNKYGVSLLTWGTILLELVLFMALTMPRKRRWSLLPIALCFHIAIAVIHGIPSFAMIMCAALILYLHPLDTPFTIRSPLSRPVSHFWFSKHSRGSEARFEAENRSQETHGGRTVRAADKA